MPIYEYRCTIESCQHELEALQKLSEDPLIYCPACGENSLKKKISAAGFRLKGTGWYETDFKNSGKKDAKKSESDGATSGDGAKKSDSGKDSSSSAKKDSGGKSSSGGSSAAA